MSRIHVPALDTASGATAELYAQIKKAAGSVPNTVTAIGAYAPDATKAGASGTFAEKQVQASGRPASRTGSASR